jgi:hypothetical protein
VVVGSDAAEGGQHEKDAGGVVAGGGGGGHWCGWGGAPFGMHILCHGHGQAEVGRVPVVTLVHTGVGSTGVPSPRAVVQVYYGAGIGKPPM